MLDDGVVGTLVRDLGAVVLVLHLPPVGVAEIVRCIVCLRTGQWPAHIEDVEEIDVIETQLSHSEYVDADSRRAAMESAHAIEEAARQRAAVSDTERRAR